METIRRVEMVGNRDAQHESQTLEKVMSTATIDGDNGEVSISKMVATARWNLLKDNRQVNLMVVKDHDEAHSSPNWVLAA
jgi:hypothetical protein